MSPPGGYQDVMNPCWDLFSMEVGTRRKTEIVSSRLSHIVSAFLVCARAHVHGNKAYFYFLTNLLRIFKKKEA